MKNIHSTRTQPLCLYVLVLEMCCNRFLGKDVFVISQLKNCVWYSWRVCCCLVVVLQKLHFEQLKIAYNSSKTKLLRSGVCESCSWHSFCFSSDWFSILRYKIQVWASLEDQQRQQGTYNIIYYLQITRDHATYWSNLKHHVQYLCLFVVYWKCNNIHRFTRLGFCYLLTIYLIDWLRCIRQYTTIEILKFLYDR